MKILILLAAIYFPTSNFQMTKGSAFPNSLNDSAFQYDTTFKKVKEFKAFTKQFFYAVEKKDVNYLHTHIIFPIVNSSLSAMDSTLKENDRINEKYFFKNLGRIFFKKIGKKIDKDGKFYASISNTKFHVRISENNDEIETTYTWFFIKRKGTFYFVQFKAEAG